MSVIGSIGSSAASWLTSTSALSSSRALGVGRNSRVNDGDGDDVGASGAASSTASSGSTTSLRDQLLAAVKQAVAGLGSDASLSDVQKAIKDAVDGTLKQNGIDPSQFAVSRPHGHHGHHAHGVKSPGIGANSPAGPSDATDSSTLQSKLMQLFLGGNSPSGSSDDTDPTSALQPFLGAVPNGSEVDLVA